MSEIAVPVGARIRAMRQELGLEVQEAAARAGIAPESWGRIENGRHVPRGETIAKVAAALGTTPAILAGGGAPGAMPGNAAESVLLHLFRVMPPDKQARFVEQAAAMAAGLPAQGFGEAMIRAMEGDEAAAREPISVPA